MFCTECGATIQEGATFCSQCGAKVATLEQAAPAATPAAAPAAASQSYAAAPAGNSIDPNYVAPKPTYGYPPKPAPAKKPINRIAIIVVAAVAVVAIIIALVLSLALKTPANSISYSTSKHIVASVSAPITICADNNKPLTHYCVVVTRSDGTINTYEVNGSSFTFESLGEQPGQVTVYVRDYNSDFSKEVPVDELTTQDDAKTRTEDAENNDEQVITDAVSIVSNKNDTPSDDADDTNRAANLALYTKLLELKNTYGDIQRITCSGSVYALDGVGILLIDLDQDGVNEMISLALDPSADATQGTANVNKYLVTVWRYNSSTHAVENIHETKISHGTNGTNSYVIVHQDSDGYISIGTESHDNNYGGEYSYFGYIPSSKTFGTVFTATSNIYESSSNNSYEVNGESVTSEKFSSDLSAWTTKDTHYSVTEMKSDTSGYSTTETVKAMQTAEKQLKAAALATTRTTSGSSADAKELFSKIAMSFSWSSGVGAWAGGLTINSDGTYTGQYHDSNMGESGSGYSATIYIGNYSGKFANVKKIDEYTYTMEVESETREGTPNEEKIENSTRYVTADSGLGVGTTITVYLAGRSTSDIPSDVLSWNPTLSERKLSTLKHSCLALDNGTAYYSES